MSNSFKNSRNDTVAANNQTERHICGLPDLEANTDVLNICHTYNLTTLIKPYYGNDPKFSDRQVCANSADPDQMAPTGAV